MKILLTILLLLSAAKVDAQFYKFEVNFSFTLPFALSKYSPKSASIVSPIKFKYPTYLKYSLNPKILLNETNKLGVFAGYDEYGYGIDISQVDGNGSAGLFIGGERLYCGLYKIGLTYEKIFFRSNKFELGSTLLLNFGKETRAKEFNDTLVENIFFRNHPFPKPNRQSLLISSDINPSLVFLPSVQINGAYKIGTRISLNIGFLFQKGFKNIVTTYTSIEIPAENKKQLYTAKFNGTAIIGNFGISYKVGQKGK